MNRASTRSLRSALTTLHLNSSSRAHNLSRTQTRDASFTVDRWSHASASSRSGSRRSLQHCLGRQSGQFRSTSTVPLKSCLHCGEAQALESLSCPACKWLQPLPSDIDFFKVMDVDQDRVPQNGWQVDTKALKQAWRLKMAVTHPDRMGGRSEKEQQIGAQQSALVNRAYETLLNPLPRAQYLLQRYGVTDISETDSLEDPELLMEVMELREQLEEAQSEDEAAVVRATNAESLQRSLDTLAKAFGSTPPDLTSARQAAVQLRYWTNIDKAAREWTPGKRVELQH